MDNIIQQISDNLIRRHPPLAPLRGAIGSAFSVLCEVFSSGGKLLVCGNGGSAADALHITGELMKGFLLERKLPETDAKAIDRAFNGQLDNASSYLQGALPAIAMVENTSLSTAFGNDVRPDMVFAQQVYGYGSPGDAFLGISTTGNSSNVIYAALTAKARGLQTIALTGPHGGELAHCCNVSINAPGSSVHEVQEYHLPIYHALCAMLEAAFFGKA